MVTHIKFFDEQKLLVDTAIIDSPDKIWDFCDNYKSTPIVNALSIMIDQSNIYDYDPSFTRIEVSGDNGKLIEALSADEFVEKLGETNTANVSLNIDDDGYINVSKNLPNQNSTDDISYYGEESVDDNFPSP